MKSGLNNKKNEVDVFFNTLQNPPLRHLLFGNDQYLKEVRQLQIKLSKELLEAVEKYPAKPGEGVRIGYITVDDSYQNISRKQMIKESLKSHIRGFKQTMGFFGLIKNTLYIGLVVTSIVMIINRAQTESYEVVENMTGIKGVSTLEK